MTKRPVVFFLCSGNSCRSQMAEAILRTMVGEACEIHSAGLEPQEIHPMTRQVLDEIGVDMTGQHAKSVKKYLGKLKVDYLIIVCRSAAKSCPTIWPGSPMMQRLAWEFDDPAGVQGTEEQQLSAFRRVRDEIRDCLKDWVAAELPSDTQPV